MRKGFTYPPRPKVLARAARPELKYQSNTWVTNSALTGTNIRVTEAFTPSVIGQGAGNGMFIGNNVCLWRIDFYIEVKHPSFQNANQGGQPYDPVLFGLYCDRDFSGAVGGVESLYDQLLVQGAAGSADRSIGTINQRFRITKNPKRWIIYERALQVGDEGTASPPFGARSYRTLRKSIAFRKGLRVQLVAGSAVGDASLHANHIYAYIIGSSDTAHYTSSTVTVKWRFWYTDG